MVATAQTHFHALTDRENHILGHVFCFRITTRDVLFRVFFEPKGLQQNAMTSVLRRLAAPYKPSLPESEQRKLAHEYHLFPRQLFGKVIYYHLTRLGLRAVAVEHNVPLGLINKLHRGLNHDARAKRYATLAFCCSPNSHRKKLTSREFREHLAEFQVRGCPTDSYYFDLSQTPPRLGLIRVDYARLPFIQTLNKCSEDLLRRIPNDHFRARAEDGQFIVSLLVPTLERKHQLDAVRQTKEPFVRDHIEVEVVRELNEVLAGRSTSR